MTRLIRILLPLALLVSMTTGSQAKPTTVIQVVQNYMQDNWQINTPEYEIELLSTQIKTDSLGDLLLELRPLTQGEPLGLFTLMAELRDNGKLIKRGQIRLRVRKYAEIFVARDRLMRHHELLKSDFELRRVEITSLREQPVRRIESSPAYRLKRNLSRGNILTQRSIEPVPDIDVGREVSILFINKMFQISAPGRALQAGTVGDIVRVKNLTSGRIVRARVVNKNSVSIDS